MPDLPTNIPAEQAVLGGVLFDPVLFDRAVDRLDADDFYDEAHRTVFRIMSECYGRGLAPDLIVVTGEGLQQGTGFDRVDWNTLLQSLTDIPTTLGSFDSYVDMVEDAAVRRSLISQAAKVEAEAAGGESADAAVEQAERLIRDTRQSRIGYSVIRTVLTDTLDDEGRRSPSKVDFGFGTLDKKLGGLQSGDLCLVAGRTSVGKTAFLLHLIRRICRKEMGVAFFSFEMSHAQVVERLLSSESGLDSRYFRDLSFHTGDGSRVAAAVGDIGDFPLYINTRRDASLSHVRSQARLLKHRHDIGLVVVDYLQLMRVHGSENRFTEVGAVSWGLKELALELGIPVVAGAQLNRQVEHREESKGPKLSDLRESGNQEQDADVVLLLHSKVETPHALRCHLAKNRNGPTGITHLNFEQEFGRFKDLG